VGADFGLWLQKISVKMPPVPSFSRSIATVLPHVSFVLVCVAIPIALLAAPTLLTDRTFAFRDGAHYYPPLLQEVHRQWNDGPPLWNANEERGRPLWADPTACVLYPGQLIFRLPIPFRQAYEWFLWLHVGLAGTTMFRCARRRKLDLAASTLAAVSYALGGTVLCQTCNLPYLISAAWLPAGLSATLDTVFYPAWSAVLRLTMVVGLLVLGGDPQTAYLLGISGCILGAMGVWRTFQEHGVAVATRAAAPILRRLAIAGLLAAGLTAAQWMPTLAWSQRSDRIESFPENQPSHLHRTDPTQSWGEINQRGRSTSPAGHSVARYAFSVAPWRWIELGWANAGGKHFPINQRWMTTIPSEGRSWSPTLYMGLATIILGLTQLRLASDRLPVCWLSWLVLLGMGGSLGSFGVGWVLGEILLQFGHETDAALHPVGGLYWVLHQGLPGFAMFRYPAKLWTWTAAGLSLLAAWQLHDRRHQTRPLMPTHWLYAYLIASIAIGLGITIWLGPLTAQLAAAPTDPLFGPLDVPRCVRGFYQSLAHGLITAVLLLTLSRRSPLRHSQSSACAIVMLTALELSLAHGWLTPTVGEPLPTAPYRARMASRATEASASSAERLCVFRLPAGTWYPASWTTSSDNHRMAACVQWDHFTARPKYSLADNVASLRSSTSFSSRDQLALLQVIDELLATDALRAIKLLELLGVHLIVAPADLPLPSVANVPISTSGNDFDRSARWYVTRNPMPLAWYVRTARTVEPIGDDTSMSQLAGQTRRVLLAPGYPELLQSEVVLEGVHESYASPSLEGSSPVRVPAQDACVVLEAEPGRIRLRVTASQPGHAVVNQAYDPGWTAERVGVATPVPVLRANRVMLGIAVPAGTHELLIRYEPAVIRWGTRISVVTLLGLCLAAAVIWASRLTLGRHGGSSRRVA
jgi:hypothetical protein